MSRPYRPGATQSVAYTGTAGTITNAFATGTNVARVIATTAAYIKIDNSPTATTSDAYLPANVPEYFIVAPGEKVSAIQVSAPGTLSVTAIS